MHAKVYYEVEVTEGRNFFGKRKTRTVLFLDNDILKARKSAIEFAIDSRNPAIRSSETKNYLSDEASELKQKSNPPSTIVYFVKSKIEKYQVFGPEVHETIYGLYEEARYYKRNGIITEDDVITVLQNKDHEDIYNPAFVLFHKPEEFPYIDFNIVKVIASDLNFLLPRNKFTLSSLAV